MNFPIVSLAFCPSPSKASSGADSRFPQIRSPPFGIILAIPPNDLSMSNLSLREKNLSKPWTARAFSWTVSFISPESNATIALGVPNKHPEILTNASMWSFTH
ncbi:hypothetical protein OGATHE_000516 [Ogataea polymorpha]|uniref:Uncharacterized protein n=1 Tax=Ogataea polymorpha TaxID=460523 RepID=A0A9P8PUK7_9ASCO|nr:hypothetical protein OGATHE_000516 [Ogataea polymorpha]